MALIKCRECAKEISDQAATCPHCGAKVKRSSLLMSILKTIFIVGGLFMIVVIYLTWSALKYAGGSRDGAARSTNSDGCTVADIEIKSVRAGFSDKCRTRSCMAFEGVGVLNNKCKSAVGVQVKLTGYDAQKNPLTSRDMWPASVSNIPPGEYVFSIDTWLDYQPGITQYSLSAINVKRW